MNDSLSLSHLSFYSPVPFYGDLPGRKTAAEGIGPNRFSGQENVPEQINIPGQEKVSGQANIPGQENTQGAGGRRAVSQKQPFDTYECETCKNRKYQDGSNDPGVSFKTPTRLSPERAAFAIRSHEAEHVAHARVRAEKENEEIVSQSVTYHTGICPECGRVYMSGGTTRTTFRSAPVIEEKPVEKGRYVDITV